MSCRTKWAGPVQAPDLEALLRASIAQRERAKARPQPAPGDGGGDLPPWTVSYPPMPTQPSRAAVAPAPVAAPLPVVAAPLPVAEVLSPSQVNGYLDCSARWKYKYVDKLPEASTGKQTRGKAVHSLVGYFFRSRMTGYTPDAGTLAEAYDEIWEAEAAEAVFSAKDDIEDLKRTGAQLGAQYIAEVGGKIRPVAIEKAVTGVIGGVQVRGFVDMLCQDESGKIIDLKVSGRTPSRVAHGHAMQLATYARLEPSCNGLVQLDTMVAIKSPKLVSVEYQVPEADVLMTERLYPWVQKQMRMGAYAPNRGSFYCSQSNCAFASQCVAEFGGLVE
jgi:putative RecB family exonuclease